MEMEIEFWKQQLKWIKEKSLYSFKFIKSGKEVLDQIAT